MARLIDATIADGSITRNRPLRSIRHSALLVVDVQYFIAAPGHGAHQDIRPDSVPDHLRYFFDRIERFVVPNTRRIQDACRRHGVEVLFTLVENLTADGRDRSLDYKISGFNVPKGSHDAQVLAAIEPRPDEIVIPKTSSSVFNSTNIDYVLRNLEVDYLIVTGLLTDQCVESTVRDACDHGYLVTVVEDACGTYTAQRHAEALKMYGGYCRIVSTDVILEEIDSLSHLGIASNS
jgi:ureidoacrylate peracid hydrolase